MDRQIDNLLHELKDRILARGGYVEKSIFEVTTALTRRDFTILSRVPEYEKAINKAHMEVDEECLKLLARQSPLASDLRLILAIIKINNDLERMGDQAVNIFYNTKHYLNSPPLTIKFEINTLTDEVRLMVHDALDAFMRKDTVLAKKVLDHDDVVDEMKDQIFKEMVTYIKSNPQHTEPALDLILIARNLERLADHATNIAEDVIFVATGQDVRHGAGR